MFSMRALFKKVNTLFGKIKVGVITLNEKTKVSILFEKEEYAINALEIIEDEYMEDPNVIYLAVIRRGSWFNYSYVVEIGYKKPVNGEFLDVLSPENLAKKIKVIRDPKYYISIFNLAKTRLITKESRVSIEFESRIEEDMKNGNPDAEVSDTSQNESVDSNGIKSGTRIGNKLDCQGTLGGIFQIDGYDELYFGISNWHVLKYDVNKNDPIYHPVLNLTVEPPKVENIICGEVCWSALDSFREAAFVQFNKDFSDRIKMSHSHVTQCGYSFSKKLREPKYNEEVIKCGFTTGCFKSNGECQSKPVYARHVTIKVDDMSYANKDTDTKTRIFRKQILVEYPATGGDSGSLLVSKVNKDVIGLIFAKNRDRKYIVANDISYLFKVPPYNDREKLKDCEDKISITGEFSKEVPLEEIKQKTIF